MHEFKNVALLPMKLNSNRVIGKNFKKLHEKPLFEWILESLLSVSEIEKIFINTDASDKLNDYPVISNEKIQLINRPQELCGDDISMNEIIKYDLTVIDAETFLMTHTTNPFLLPCTIKQALSSFYNNTNCDSLFTVNKFQSRFYDTNLKPINHDPNKLIKTQDLEIWYEENSNLYIFSKDSFAKTKARIGKNPQIFETKKFESIDIDDNDDWHLAELIAASIKYD